MITKPARQKNAAKIKILAALSVLLRRHPEPLCSACCHRHSGWLHCGQDIVEAMSSSVQTSLDRSDWAVKHNAHFL